MSLPASVVAEQPLADLVRRFRGQFPVPTYVVEFMLGRYCASTDPKKIEEGVEMVQEQSTARSVRAGEEELFKARALDKGQDDRHHHHDTGTGLTWTSGATSRSRCS